MEKRYQLIVAEYFDEELVKKTNYYQLTREELDNIINAFRDELLDGRLVSMSHSVDSNGQPDEIIVSRTRASDVIK